MARSETAVSLSSRHRLWGKTTTGVVLPTEFPLGYPGPDVVFRAARLAEDIGYDALWVGDHIVWHCPNLECLSSLAAVTGVTKSIVLGSGVLLLPLRHPVHAAKVITTVDQLSGGRLVVGVGVGGENPIEFSATGSELAGRGRRTDASIRAIRAMASDNGTAADHRLPGIPPFRMQPGGVHAGGPPILVGGRSKAALRRSATLGDGWMGLFMTADRFAECFSHVREHALQIGRGADDLLASILVFVMVNDRKSAFDTAASWLQGQFGADPEHLMRYAIVGSPAKVEEELSLFRARGVQHLILSFMGPNPSEQMERVGGRFLEPSGG